MSSFLEDMLDAAYDVDKIEEQANSRPPQTRVAPQRQQPMSQRGAMVSASTPDDIDKLLESMEDDIHGPSVAVPQSQGYDPNAEMERIKKIQENGGMIPQEYAQRSGMPRAIVESIMANPCNLDPSIIDSDPRREELDNKLIAKFGKGIGESVNPFDRVNEINDILDESDAQKVPQSKTQTQNVAAGGVSNVDYSLIKTIVSAVLDEKLEAIKKSLLTESARPMPNLANIKAVSMKDKVLFVDSNDDVYECTFIHRGKNRKKK